MDGYGERRLTVRVFPDESAMQPIRASIARYRAACRQIFADVLVFQCAGAELQEHGDGVRMKPKNDRAKLLGGLAVGTATIECGERVHGQGQEFKVRVGTQSVYEFREHVKLLYPTALSFVGDSIRRRVWDRWTSLDPEFPTATRGYLTLQGAREAGRFGRVGIEFPQATGRPQLGLQSIVLKWDHAIGKVEFSPESMDLGRYWRWGRVVGGEWPAGTVTLTERDGKLFLGVSYYQPRDVRSLDPLRVLTVRVAEDGTGLALVGPDAEHTYDSVGFAAAAAVLGKLRVQRLYWEECQQSCGAPSKPWGDRPRWKGAQKHLSMVTDRRERFLKDCCHAWSRRIASRAAAWRCGAVVLHPPTEIVGHSFAAYQFGQCVRYKLEHIGCSLTIEKSENPENPGAPTAP